MAAHRAHGLLHHGGITMEREIFLSGYCRCLDASRMVCAVLEDDCLVEIDCNMGTCPYESECSVAQKVREQLHP